MIQIENMCSYYQMGSPCKIERNGAAVFGRYVGNSSKGSIAETDDGPICSIIIMVTPGDSIIVSGRCHIIFELTKEDLLKLEGFERDAIAQGEWYHKQRTAEELEVWGEFMPHEDIKPIILN
jgi:hypothetical protein